MGHGRDRLAYLPAGRQGEFRRKLQNGYQQPTYEKAKAALKKVRAELATINQSAVGLRLACRSRREGVDTFQTLSADLGRFGDVAGDRRGVVSRCSAATYVDWAIQDLNL